MQDDGPLGPDGWKALIAFCDAQRRRVFAQLEPLEDGTVHTGKRGMSGAWVETTTEDIQRLRKELANIDTALSQARANAR